MNAAPDRTHLAIYLSSLSGGGAQRRTVTLANAFAARVPQVDLVLADPRGPLASQVSERVRVVPLREWGALSQGLGRGARLPRRGALMLAAGALCRYLRTVRPSVLLSAANHVHLPALFAHKLSKGACPIVLRVSNHLSRQRVRSHRRRLTPWVARRMYPRAEAFISVSHSVASDLIENVRLDPWRISNVYNPVVTPELRARAEAPLDHPWLAPGEPPVVLAVGRLVTQKDFPTLVRAFARVRARVPVRLLILGEAKPNRQRRRLEQLISQLGVANSVRLQGYVANPLPYMKRAGVLALSSAWEGLPGVLIEAMACGCPVVSTDCPGGSAEVLQDGKLGPLMPVGDDHAMADAILSQLENPTERALLEARANEFTLDVAVDRYLEVLQLRG